MSYAALLICTVKDKARSTASAVTDKVAGILGMAGKGEGKPLLDYDLQFFASKPGSGTPKTSRKQAFRQAKEATGIPKSAQYKTHKFVYDGTSENRIVYEFEVNGERKYIIEHPFDKMGRGNHFHGADASKGSPFDKGRYNQYDGHFPEDFDGFY